MEEKCLHPMQLSFKYARENYTLISISKSTDKKEMASFWDVYMLGFQV